MFERIKKLKNARRPITSHKPDCPVCKVEMKRKGKKGPNEYFKCPTCKGKMSHGNFALPKNPATIDMINYQSKAFKNEMSKRKFIMTEKKERKWNALEEFRFNGEFIRLDDYDMDGISFADKKEMARQLKEAKKAQKRQEREAKKKQVSTKNVS